MGAGPAAHGCGPAAARRGGGPAGPPGRRDRRGAAGLRRGGHRRRQREVGAAGGRGRVPGVERYVGGHPMAGSERSGPLAASAALFDGRPWAVTPHDGSDPGAVELVEALARLCGAVPVRLSPVEHDRAVARTSHIPHLLSALAAGPAGRGARRPPGASRPGRARRDPRRCRRPGALRADRGRQLRAGPGLLAEVRDRLDAVIDAVGQPTGARSDELLRRVWPAPWPSPASTAVRPGRPIGVRVGARPPRRAGPGVRGRRAPARSTSRTCTSTTTRVGRSGWSS